MYNDNNVQTASIDALENTTEFTYDKNNRLIETEDPASNTTSQTYDNAGNIDSKTDGRSNTTTFTYDAFKRLIAVENALGEITAYTYDNAGNMLTQTDGNENTTTFAYNVRNLPVRKADSGGITQENGTTVYDPARTETYSYRADGKLQQKVDRNGVQSQYTYDIHARLTLETAGADTISYTYDNNDNQLTVTDSTGTITRTYDALNRVLTKIVPVLGTSTFIYDITAGLPAGYVGSSTTDPKANTVTKIVDKAGRLYQVKDGSTVKATYTYYDNGSLQKLQYPGSSEEYTYYPNNLLHTLVNKTGGAIFEAYSYIYDEAGNQTQKTDAKGITNYTYDELNRLLTVTEPDSKVTAYTFDAAGNRLSESITHNNATVTTAYTYNGQNRLMQTEKTLGSGAVQTLTFTYDNNGNMLSQLQSLLTDAPEGGTGEDSTEVGLSRLGDNTEGQDGIYEYDVRNRLIRVSQGGHIIENTYNGEGLRIAKTTDGQTLRYLYEYDRIILETDGTGSTVSARNLFGTNLISRSVDGETLDYLYNGHGDVTALVSGSTVIAGYYYDAFGVPTEETGSADNPYRYAGYEYDAEISLYNLKARFYNASIARFLQEDTYRGDVKDPLSLNLYTYCANEPIMYTDPSGHIKVYGNETDIYAFQASVGHALGYSYVFTQGGNFTVEPGSIVVGGTGAVGGVGADIDIGGSHRIWGDDRGKTKDAIDNYLYLSSHSSSGSSGDYASTGAIVWIANTLSSMNINLKSTGTSYNTLDPSANMGTQTVKSTNSMNPGSKGYLTVQGMGNNTFTTQSRPTLSQYREQALKDLNNRTLEANRINGLVDDAGRPFMTKEQAEFNELVADIIVYGNVAMLGGAALESAGKLIAPLAGKIGSFFGNNKIPSTLTKEEINAANAVDLRMQAQRGIGGKGWRGDSTWKSNVNTIKDGGTIEKINGAVPSQKEAIDLINASGGKVIRIENAHPAGGISNHTYPHINYTTPSGIKGTIQIQGVVK